MTQRQLIGIVRDKNGKPKFDDPLNVPPAMIAALTDRDVMLLDDWEVAAMGLSARKQAIKKGN